MIRIGNALRGAVIAAAVVAMGTPAVAIARPPAGYKCEGDLKEPPGPFQDLEVDDLCTVNAGTYKLGNVNIYGKGKLLFTDNKIDFWARSILVENGASLIAGSPEGTGDGPIGTKGGVLTIHLYGADQTKNDINKHGAGIECRTDAHCGIPNDIWDSDNTAVPPPPPPATKPPQEKVTLRPSSVHDYFYKYEPLMYDEGGTTPGFFGYKVLAVSYGGTLHLFGKKGATYGDTKAPFQSGTSWVRLAKTVKAGESTLVFDRAVDWQVGDHVAVTTTDYLPGHSEEAEITEIVSPTSVKLKAPLANSHWGEQYDLKRIPAGQGPDFAANEATVAETRAAVALLTRSIRIVSEGDESMCANNAVTCFPDSPYYFGGHTIVRQGVLSYQVQGVEFKQLGQGGRIGHYPVHFHMVRLPPANTFVKDSSINESMTRWITIHSSQQITLERNVGFESIGHGFYMEDGTEIDNKLRYNIGIYARAAVMNSDGTANPQNPRMVPGILAAPDLQNFVGEAVPKKSDWDHPTVFWFLNGWNEFTGNMAAGAGTCGVCYWFVPATNSGHSSHEIWEGYASIQANGRQATSPLQSFVSNFCTSAMNSFNTVDNTSPCAGVGGPASDAHLAAVPNLLAPNSGDTMYYPRVGGLRAATRCNQTDCSTVPICNSDPNPGAPAELNCMITAIDRYTTSFHWTEHNFAAMWLRPQWYLVTNSIISDVQNGGLTFVTGGDYTRSSTINGHWALARKNAFIGNVQPITTPADKPAFPDNGFASNAGPFNPNGITKCDNTDNSYCLSVKEGVTFPRSSFAVNQRMFNIYDGPAYQESNSYLDITPTVISDCKPSVDGRLCEGSKFMYSRILGMPQDDNGICYLPNAAIAWKQPNGFYYPPAFHSTNLYFDPEMPGVHSVKFRHFVVEPLFKEVANGEPGSFLTNEADAKKRYCNWNGGMFTGFTDIDRQTELTDNDGSLTGYSKTISVNLDPFYNAPVEAIECASDVTAKTSPYDYVTTVLYPGCTQTGASPRFGCSSPEALPPVCDKPPPSHLADCSCDGDLCDWARSCTNQNCYGVPLFRQLLTKSEHDAGKTPNSRMMGETLWQRNTLTVNNGNYYMDTTAGRDKQRNTIKGWFPGTPDSSINVNLFKANETYYMFFLFATPETKQTYQMYVGKNLDFDATKSVGLTRANISAIPVTFTAGDWPSGAEADKWSRVYDKNTGIVTVSVDMSIQAFRDGYALAGADRCRPFSFCGWNDTTKKCGCAANVGDYPASVVEACQQKNSNGDDAICSWAVKDFDCPRGGCFGFSVTLPGEFKTDPVDNPYQLAASRCLLSTDKAWNINFTPADPASLAGSCAGSPISSKDFCTP